MTSYSEFSPEKKKQFWKLIVQLVVLTGVALVLLWVYVALH